MELTEFTINVDSDPDLTALVGGQRVSILKLDLSGLQAQRQRPSDHARRGEGKPDRGCCDGTESGVLDVRRSRRALTLGTATVKARAR